VKTVSCCCETHTLLGLISFFFFRFIVAEAEQISHHFSINTLPFTKITSDSSTLLVMIFLFTCMVISGYKEARKQAVHIFFFNNLSDHTLKKV
jgi:hypothetical protein